RRFDPELDTFLIADAMRPVQAQAGFTVLPNYSFQDSPAMDAFLIPGGFGTRQEVHNRRLHEFVRSLPEETLLTSVCTGPVGCGGRRGCGAPRARRRRGRAGAEASGAGRVRTAGLPGVAPPCRVSRARVGDAGRIVPAGGITAGMEMGFHLLRRAGYGED